MFLYFYGLICIKGKLGFLGFWLNLLRLKAYYHRFWLAPMEPLFTITHSNISFWFDHDITWLIFSDTLWLSDTLLLSISTYAWWCGHLWWIIWILFIYSVYFRFICFVQFMWHVHLDSYLDLSCVVRGEGWAYNLFVMMPCTLYF